jgi:predicted alpha/beta superfamily hydrolase
MLAIILAAAMSTAALSTPNSTTSDPTSVAPATSPARLPGSVQFDMTSKITGRTYRIYVNRPMKPAPPGGFPVLYLLDGDWAFGAASFQAVAAPLDGRSDIVLIGIGYPEGNPFLRRNPDLTPSMPSGSTLVDAKETWGPVKSGAFGDAEGFHRFLMEELRPIVTQAYKTDPKNQSLMGYSLGGLFALHVLFQHPDSYRSYVIGSPSIWWNDREVLKDEAAFKDLVRAGKVAPRILITSDEWEQFEGSPDLPPPGPKREEVLADLRKSKMVDNARDLATRLTALKGNADYKVHYTLFREETHLSGLPAATSRGVAFVAEKN